MRTIDDKLLNPGFVGMLRGCNLRTRQRGRFLPASYLLAIFVPVLFVTPVGADHANGAAWSWHVVSAGSDESRVAIYRQRDLLGIFDFSCDLTPEHDTGDEPAASLELVQPESHPGGLLVIHCNVGAHSQYLALVDPAQRSVRPVFEVTGSYHAGWEIQDGELWIGYDQPCAEGISVECPDGFETVFVQYPAR